MHNARYTERKQSAPLQIGAEINIGIFKALCKHLLYVFALVYSQQSLSTDCLCSVHLVALEFPTLGVIRHSALRKRTNKYKTLT
jgi:hypothetical protein